MPDLKILDCTLRDGGYYNDWDFSESLARDLFSGLAHARVDIIEVGYKSPVREGFSGLYRYCVEPMLRDMLPPERPELAFMLDAKEFLASGGPDLSLLERTVGPREGSLFSWCRLATTAQALEPTLRLARLLSELGYQVAVNIMSASTLQAERVHEIGRMVGDAPISALYFADSYGSLTPSDTAHLIRQAREAFPGAIGVHMHDNLGLAFPNTLAAIEAGATFIDATVAGMGRGAGNLRLEQLLLFLYFRHGVRHLDPSALIAPLQRHFMPLQQEYQWGWDFNYMLSGLREIHPSYCQHLKADERYTIDQVAGILEAIPPEKRPKYDEAELLRSAERAVQTHRSPAEALPVARTYAPPSAERVLIVAGGPAALRHARAVQAYVERHAPLVIECNLTGVLGSLPRTIAVLNDVRLNQLLERAEELPEQARIVTGLEAVPPALGRHMPRRLPYQLSAREFAASEDCVTIPDYVVGMYALALATLSRPRRIELVGFDGFDSSEGKLQNEAMNSFWTLARSSGPMAGVELVSLLPTRYDLPVESLYSQLT